MKPTLASDSGRHEDTNAEALELLAEIKDRFELVEGAEADNRANMSEDLQFVYEVGQQWDGPTLLRRKGRPCYSYNRVVGVVNQIVGDQRMSRPQCKVRAVTKAGSAKTAEVFGGMCRNIEACSDAPGIYDQQFKYAVAGGWGAWRILPEFMSDDTFDQELRIKAVSNPFTVYWDTAAVDPTKKDANWAIIAERIDKDLFNQQYPDAVAASVQVSRDSRGWTTDKEVRVAEYFKRTFKKKKIALLSDGQVIDYTPAVKDDEKRLDQLEAEGVKLDVPRVVNVRDTKEWTVTWWKVDGTNILEGPIEYKWKRIPVIRLPGRFVNIEGKQKLQSVIRHARDAQRSYNYHRSTMVELAALTPRAPYIVTNKMVKGYADQWNTANSTNKPYLEYDVDPAAPGARPQREPPPDVPQAMIALAAQDAEDIKATTGYFDPSLGIQDGQPRSGKAIIAEQRKGDLGSYEFLDNFGKAIQATWECLIDMIPTVYDTERVVRTIGDDGVEDYQTVNAEPTPDQAEDTRETAIALAEGAYDVTVTIGPSYATQRQETLAVLMDAVQAMPMLADIAPDIIVKNLDIPDSNELEKRVRMLLIQQGKIQPNEREQQEMGPPPPPDPTQTALVERLQAQSAKDAALAGKYHAETQALPTTQMLDVEQQTADIVNKRLQSLKTAGEIAAGPATVAGERRKALDGNART